MLATARGRRGRARSAASLTFFWRALLKIKHVPEQLFDVIAFPIIGLLMFTYLFGGALAGSTGDYLQYVLPGILVQTVVMITMYTGVGLNTDVTKGVFDRFRSLPIWRPAALVGMLLGDVVRYTIAGSMIVLVGLILGFRPDGGVLGVLAGLGLVLVFSFSLAWVWTLARPRRAHAAVGDGLEHDGPLPADLHLQRLRRPGDDAVAGCARSSRSTRSGCSSPPSAAAWRATRTPATSAWALLCSALLVAIFGPLTMRRYNAER